MYGTNLATDPLLRTVPATPCAIFMLCVSEWYLRQHNTTQHTAPQPLHSLYGHESTVAYTVHLGRWHLTSVTVISDSKFCSRPLIAELRPPANPPIRYRRLLAIAFASVPRPIDCSAIESIGSAMGVPYAGEMLMTCRIYGESCHSTQGDVVTRALLTRFGRCMPWFQLQVASGVYSLSTS
jgi:hypothetical protein